MSETGTFFSIWAQQSPYWLVVEGGTLLPGSEMLHTKPAFWGMQTGPEWQESWRTLAAQIRRNAPDGLGYRAAVIASDALPGIQEIQLSLRPLAEIDAIANNLWLVSDVNHGRLGCYMQRVLDRRSKVVGYEAFARMESADGGVVGGGAIMQAATALRVEYQLDRLLHKQAIESFVLGDLDGYIFINFLTGFIHRPEVYLDGLSQAAARYQIRAGAVVLDVPITDYAADIPKLKTIASYCQSRGFALALDDVRTPGRLAPLLREIKPAFVKLDGKMGNALGDPRQLAALREIVRLSHEVGASVLAEGVENAAMHDTYVRCEVDMFQGYHFGAPERYSAPPTAQRAWS